MTGNPPDLGHVVAHLAKYTGLLAEIVEHLGHPERPEKRAKALARAEEFLAEGRHNGIRWCAGQASRQLREILCPTCQAGFPRRLVATAHLREVHHLTNENGHLDEAVARARVVFDPGES